MMHRAAHRMAHVIVSCVPVSVCHVIHRKIGRANLCLRGVNDQRVDQRSRLTYMYRDRNVQLSNAWVFANKGLINPMQLTELFSIW